MKYLKKLLYAILNPQCLRGVGIFFNSSKSAHWHRKLAFNIHPKLSRFQWYAILLASVLCWYLCIFWIQFTHSIFITFQQKKLTPKTIPNLLYLGLWIGASPYNYFFLNLYDEKIKIFSSYIFIEEQLSWYMIFNQKKGVKSQERQKDLSSLQDKQAFSDLLLDKGFPAIPSIETFSTSLTNQPHAIEKNIDKLIEAGVDFFIKPRFGNALRGCLWVTVNQSTQECTAFGFTMSKKNIQLKNKKSLVEYISESLEFLANAKNSIGNKQSLLVQKQYKSNIQIQNALNTTLPISLRLITFRQKQFSEKIQLLYAFIEKSQTTHNNMNWQTYNIDITSGRFINHQIEEWSSIVESITKAHSIFPSINSIAWDAILSETGLKIIEGNYGWETIEPQRLSRKPILKSSLFSIK